MRRGVAAMAAEIIPLPGVSSSSSIAHFIRVGEQNHLQLEELHSQGQFPTKRVVIDASRFKFQKKFFEILKADSVELVLDTKAAELAEPAKCKGYARYAPWADAKNPQPIGPKAYQDGKIIGQI